VASAAILLTRAENNRAAPGFHRRTTQNMALPAPASSSTSLPLSAARYASPLPLYLAL